MKAGYTLIEILVVTALLGMLTIGLIQLSFSFNRVNTQQTIKLAAKNQATSTLEFVASKIRPGVNCQGSATQLTIIDPESQSHIFTLRNNSLFYQPPSGSEVQLLSNDFRLTNASWFTCQPPKVTVKLVLQPTTQICPNCQVEVEQTILMRNAK